MLGVACYAAVAAREAVQSPFMTPEVASELQIIRQQIADPRTTLVVAPHGLEWWAGHILGTRVRSGPSIDTSRQYSRVLILRNTVGCPRDVVNPFPGPPMTAAARQVYSGSCLEAFQSQ